MRTGGLRGFAGLVLTLVLASTIALPLTAFALPFVAPSYMLTADDPGSDGDTVAVSTTSSTRALGPPGTAGAPGDTNRHVPVGPPSNVTGPAAGTDSQLGMPDVVLAAYRNAARSAPSLASGCRLDWAVLAGIGRVESRHGMHFGVDSVIDTQGTVRKQIIGPALNGTGAVSSIPDTDEGLWDGDRTWDRAVGPMQFIPSSWRRYGQDGNGDGVRDPHNVFDAALSAVAHLCGTAAVDLADDEHLDRALYAYNRSEEYVKTVRRWIDIYRSTDPSDVPRVAVRNDPSASGPLSPFPAPDERIAGVFEAATPLSPSKLAAASDETDTAVGSKGAKVADRADAKSSSTSKNKKGATSDKKSTSASKNSKGTKKKAAVSSKASETPSASSSPKPSPDPSPSAPAPSAPAPSAPAPSAPAPSPSAPEAAPEPEPASEPKPEPKPEPEPEPKPESKSESKPEPEPKSEPVPAPEPSGGGESSDAPTADPVDLSSKRPDIAYDTGVASDWPKACRPAGLWADVGDAVAADRVSVATGLVTAVEDADDRLTVTWRTQDESVWRVTTHDCSTGKLVAAGTAV